jgi:hypothetical protein
VHGFGFGSGSFSSFGFGSGFSSGFASGFFFSGFFSCFSFGGGLISTHLTVRPPLQYIFFLIFSGQQPTTVIVTVFSFLSYVWFWISLVH